MAKKLTGIKTVFSQDHKAELAKPQIVVQEIPLEQISPDPDQPRKTFDQVKLAELAESIREKGVIQPVIVRKGEGRGYVLIAGERRYRACKIAKLATIPAILRADEDHDIVSLIENLQREDLKPLEEAEALERLQQQRGLSLAQLSKVTGKSRSTLSETLSINKLPEEIKKGVRTSEQQELFTKSVLLEISKQGDPAKAKRLFNKVRRSEIKTTREVRSETRQNKAVDPVESVNRLVNKIREMAAAHPEKSGEISRVVEGLVRELKMGDTKPVGKL